MGPAPKGRSELYERIDAISSILVADVPRGDELRRLPDTTVAALRDAGLLELKVPADLGGDEAEPRLQFEVFERMALSSACAAWCWFIYADSLGGACARLPQDGVDRLLEHGFPTVCGGGGLRPGRLSPTDGGFRFSGNFRYGSGIHGAEWALLMGVVDSPSGHPEVRMCVVPTRELAVGDTWHVLGMKGTGSTDYAAHDVFVPEAMTYPAAITPRRGGRMYRTGIAGYLGYPLPAVATGIVQRALDELVTGAATTMRGYGRPTSLASRPTFHSFVGEADLRLRAGRALMLRDGDELMEHVELGSPDQRRLEARTRAAGAWVVRNVSGVLSDIARFAGGGAMREGTVIERAVRDLSVAATHLLVSDSSYENHGQFLLGIEGADPMA